MNALRILIAVFWLVMSGVGGVAQATPSAPEDTLMACHEEDGHPSEAERTPHKAMPCCAHALGAPIPSFPLQSLMTVPLQHPIEQDAQPRTLSPYPEPDPPRNV